MHSYVWPGETRRGETQILVLSDQVTGESTHKEKCTCLLRDKSPSHSFSYSCDPVLLETQQSSSALGLLIFCFQANSYRYRCVPAASATNPSWKCKISNPAIPK